MNRIICYHGGVLDTDSVGSLKSNIIVNDNVKSRIL